MRHCIAAYTDSLSPPPGAVVPYVSINREASGEVRVTVRNSDGVTAEASVPGRDWVRIARELFSDACTTAA